MSPELEQTPPQKAPGTRRWRLPRWPWFRTAGRRSTGSVEAAANPRTSGSQTATTFLVLTLLLTLLEVFARYVPNTWINRDGRFYTNTNVTLTESLSLEQDEFCASWYDGEQGWNRHLDAGWSNVAVGRNDRRLPKHPALMPIVSTPFFWAFGMHGTLLFNILAFALGATAVFLFTRRYASSSAAAIAALTFVFATSIRDYAYDYHVDVLLLCFFASGVAALHARRGWFAGFLIGGAVVLKPTTLMWLPSLVLIASTKERWPALWRSLLSGTLVLCLLAISNWWLFGKPWWAGYNRVLVVVAGQPQVLDVGSAFNIPFDQGFEVLWKGPLGVRSRLTVMLLALPGLLWMTRKHWRYVLATVLAVGLAVAVFARYQWYHDRFLWPAFALLTPGLAVGLDVLGRNLRAAVRRRPVLRPGIAAALGAMVLVGAWFAVGGDLEARLPQSPSSLGATAVSQGTFDLREAFGEDAMTPLMGGQSSMVSLTQRGTWVARVSPIVSVLSAPFAWAGRPGFVLLHMLLAGLLAFGCARLAERVSPGPISLAAPLALLLLPGVRERIALGGPELFTATFVVGALALAAYGHWLSAGVVGALAAWTALAPIPIALAVLALAPRGKQLTDAAAGIAVVALSAMGVATWLWGSPLATAHDAVLIAGGVQGVAIAGPPLSQTWDLLTEGAGLAWLGLFAIGALGARRSKLVAFGAICVLAVLWPSVRATSPLPLFVLALLSLGWPEFVRRGGAWVERWTELSVGRRVRIVSALFFGLFVVGAVTRVEAAGSPVAFASYRGLREAKVFLGEAPCDFLNWQHMNWECTTRDHGTENMVGLQVTDGVLVGGEERTLMRIPNTGRQNRRVRWDGLRASERFRIRWAVPDDAPPRPRRTGRLPQRNGPDEDVEDGGENDEGRPATPTRPATPAARTNAVEPAVLIVRLDGEELARIPLPNEPDGRVHARSFSSGSLEGALVSIELELEGRAAVVAVDGGFLD